MEDDEDFFEDYNLAIFFGESEAPTLEDVLPSPVNLQGHSTIAAGHARVIPEYHFEAAEDVLPPDMLLDESTILDDEYLRQLLYPEGLSDVAGHESTSPENPLETAVEAYSTQEYDGYEQPTAAEVLRQEFGQHQDDRQPEQEYQETVPQLGFDQLSLLRFSDVAGNEIISPKNPPEHEQSAAAQVLRQEFGQHQDDRQPEQEYQETVPQLGFDQLSLLRFSDVAGNEIISPENPPELEQSAAAQVPMQMTTHDANWHGHF